MACSVRRLEDQALGSTRRVRQRSLLLDGDGDLAVEVVSEEGKLRPCALFLTGPTASGAAGLQDDEGEDHEDAEYQDDADPPVRRLPRPFPLEAFPRRAHPGQEPGGRRPRGPAPGREGRTRRRQAQEPVHPGGQRQGHPRPDRPGEMPEPGLAAPRQGPGLRPQAAQGPGQPPVPRPRRQQDHGPRAPGRVWRSSST